MSRPYVLIDCELGTNLTFLCSYKIEYFVSKKKNFSTPVLIFHNIFYATTIPLYLIYSLTAILKITSIKLKLLQELDRSSQLKN